MTDEQLRRLAEIAGYRYDTKYGVYLSESGTLEGSLTKREWQPHLRIEHAMMVAEEFPEWKIGKYENSFNRKPIEYECVLIIEDCELYDTGDTPALAICRAALAAKEEKI